MAVIAAFDAFLLFAIGVQFSRLWFGFFLIFSCLIIPYGREKAKIWMIHRRTWYQPTYFVGTGSNARRTAEALNSDTSLGHEVCGFIKLQSEVESTPTLDGIQILNDVEQARYLSGKYTTLVFAFETMQEMDENRSLINQTIAESIQVTIVPPSMELINRSMSLADVLKLPMQKVCSWMSGLRETGACGMA